MPPLANLSRPLALRSQGSSTIAAFLVPLLQGRQQTRSASILGSLSDVSSAYNKRIRRGRGPSSGKGKTSGRGHKGQKQHGKVPAGFNGGQTPDEVVHGTRGFENHFALDITTLNLDRIQSWIDQGRLDPSKPITVKELHESRCTHGIKDGLKLLARNADTLRTPIHITVSRASATAIAAIEAAGGSVQTRYYTHNAINNILRGLSHPTQSLMSPKASQSSTTLAPTPKSQDTASAPQPGADTAIAAAAAAAAPPSPYPPPSAFRYRLPDATSRKDIEYYRDPAHRGYLSHMVEEGAGPSLFWKTPGQVTASSDAVQRKKAKKAGAQVQGPGSLW